MKRLALAASLAVATAGVSSGAQAFGIQGIQIDPTGTGCVPCSFVANGLGSDFGDMLLDSMVAVASGNSGTVFAHNVFDLDTAGDSGELTFVMWMEATANPTISTVDVGGILLSQANPNQIFVTNPMGHASYFALYYDPLDGADPNSGVAANHDTGAGYDDGVLLASGNVSVDIGGGGSPNFNVTLDTTQSNVPLDSEAGSIQTASLGGGVFLDIEFDEASQTSSYLLNNLVTLDVDLEVNGGILAPYDAVRASDRVGGTSGPGGAFVDGADHLGGVLNAGTDNENDFTCSIVGNQTSVIPPPSPADGDCDVQFQVTSVLDFNALSIPEPGTVGLIGAGLGLAGFMNRRRRRAEKSAS